MSKTSTSSEDRAQAIRSAARDQWGHDPAGSIATGDAPLGTPEAFARVEAHRYREQPWMHRTFKFERYAGQRVLEIGVGLGTDHLQFARAGAQMTGVDLTSRCVELTRRRFEQEGLESSLHVMDAESLDFPSACFDAVYSFGVLHHIPSIERAFDEVRRVLRPGGVFIGGLYNRRSFVTAWLRLGWARHGGNRVEPFADKVSRVEWSSGGDAKPYVRLLTAAGLKATLAEAGFSEVTLRRRHVGMGQLSEFLPVPAQEALGRVGGWYLVHEAR